MKAVLVLGDFSINGWKMAPMVINLPLDYILLAGKLTINIKKKNFFIISAIFGNSISRTIILGFDIMYFLSRKVLFLKNCFFYDKLMEYDGVCFSGMSDCHMKRLERIQ
jgi:hypothetical protein